MWYAAHAVFYFKLIDESQDSFLVHENIYIISAADSNAARVRAEIIGQANEDSGDDGHLELNEKKASYVFAGIRKIIEAETKIYSALGISSPGLIWKNVAYMKTP